MTTTMIREQKSKLQEIALLAADAGIVTNNRFKRAMRALNALEKIIEDRPAPEGTRYRVTMMNGRETVLFVPKGGSIFAVAKEERVEIQSFVAIE